MGEACLRCLCFPCSFQPFPSPSDLLPPTCEMGSGIRVSFPGAVAVSVQRDPRWAGVSCRALLALGDYTTQVILGLAAFFPVSRTGTGHRACLRAESKELALGTTGETEMRLQEVGSQPGEGKEAKNRKVRGLMTCGQLG